MELTIAVITAFVGVLNEGTKSIAKALGKDINRYIPIFSILYGTILGVCGFFLPDTKVGANLIESVIIGISAGLASTGCHQVFHQLSSKPEEIIDDGIVYKDPLSDDEKLEDLINTATDAINNIADQSDDDDDDGYYEV